MGWYFLWNACARAPPSGGRRQLADRFAFVGVGAPYSANPTSPEPDRARASVTIIFGNDTSARAPGLRLIGWIWGCTVVPPGGASRPGSEGWNPGKRLRTPSHQSVCAGVMNTQPRAKERSAEEHATRAQCTHGPTDRRAVQHSTLSSPS